MRKSKTLTDRERIVFHLIKRLYLSQPSDRHLPRSYWDDRPGYFALWQQPQPGDLVYVTSGPMGKFRIGWFVSGNRDAFTVRELGGEDLCEWTNATCVPICGLPPEETFAGSQRQFYHKLMRVFSQGALYPYLYGGLRFEGKEACVTLRERFLREGSMPLTVRFPWASRMSMKKILKYLVVEIASVFT